MPSTLLQLLSMLAVSAAVRMLKKRNVRQIADTNRPRGDKSLPACISLRQINWTLVEKQASGGLLSRQEAISMILKAEGVPGHTCGAVSTTTLARTRPKHGGCIEKGKAYTVCYDTNGNDKHALVGPKAEWHCGIFIGGAKAIRENGGVDCLGACNEQTWHGRQSCDVRKHRFSCMAHDVCSLVQDASGFTEDKQCGNEAGWAVLNAGGCKGDRW